MKRQIAPQNDRATYLEAMSRVASTVSIVTTDGSAGPAGATVSSLVSVSADTAKPTVLICLHRDSRTSQAVLENASMCINVLGADQEVTAAVFAGQSAGGIEQKFTGFGWNTGATGAPRLIRAPITLDCQVVQSTRVGLHDVIFGEVEDVVIGRDIAPLLYARRAFWTSADTELFAA